MWSLLRDLIREPDYFELVFGLPPGPAEVQSAFVVLPDGST